MTISVDWAGTSAIPYQITVEKADLSLVDAGPPEIYELDLDAFRLALRDLEDEVDGRPWPRTHDHQTEVTLAGVTFARVIRILAPYSITFEDGQYAVNLVGANTNLHELVNVNQVSIRASNSAGLVNPAGVTPPTPAEIAAAVWQEILAGHVDPGSAAVVLAAIKADTDTLKATTATIEASAATLLARLTEVRAAALDGLALQGADISLLKKVAINRLELADGSTDNWVLYDDDGVTPIATWSVRDKAGGPIVQPAGAPSRRSAAI